MPLDANGIWQYTEGESAAPASTMLNRLAASVSSKFGGSRSWRSVGTLVSAPSVPANTATSVLPAAIVITGAPAGTYQLTAMVAAFSAAIAAATVQFRVNGATVFEPRNDLPAGVGFTQSHTWTIEHTGGTLTLDVRLLCPTAAAQYQTSGTGLVVTRVL